MSTECENCKFREGDCGYHHMSDGITNYDIASLSACDKYGNCMFFERMAENKGDLISREALKKLLEEDLQSGGTKTDEFDKGYDLGIEKAIETIDNAPTVEPEITNDDLQAAMTESYHLGYELAETKFKRPQGEWLITAEDSEGIHRIQCPFCRYEKGSDFIDYITVTFEKLPPFCESCGAELREEKSDEQTTD